MMHDAVYAQSRRREVTQEVRVCVCVCVAQAQVPTEGDAGWISNEVTNLPTLYFELTYHMYAHRLHGA
jgi:hypothetical protein